MKIACGADGFAGVHCSHENSSTVEMFCGAGVVYDLHLVMKIQVQWKHHAAQQKDLTYTKTLLINMFPIFPLNILFSILM